MTDISIAKTQHRQFAVNGIEKGFLSCFGENWCRTIVFKALAQLKVGSLTIEEAGQSYSFGNLQQDNTPSPEHSDRLHATLIVRDPSVYRFIASGGSVGAGESYMQGLWDTPDLVSLIRLMARNLQWLNRLDSSRSWIFRGLSRLMHRLNKNNRQGSRRNISAHYDVGNDFFSLFLDPSLMYSSAIYHEQDWDLDTAAEYKLAAVCKKLNLEKTDHVLEIGTGWGGLAIYMAKHFGCRVTTTTLSREQFDFAQRAVRDAGLEDRVTLLLSDYRDLEGQYDKLVSIEMIEAVGHQYYATFFKQCSALLKPQGLMLIQAITIPDQRYDQARHSVDFIQRYIFPGGSLPCNGIMSAHIARDTDMQLCDLHDIGLDYAQTLAHWHERFMARMDQVKQQGFDEVFCRMWRFYLAYCEGGFRERAISTVQILCAKPEARLSAHR